MKLLDKIKWILGILMVFLLVVFTNLVDRNNFLRVSKAVESIYEDRLVVKDLILTISNLIHEKEIATIKSDSAFYSQMNSKINSEVESNILIYNQTKMTRPEKEILNRFIADYEELKAKEEAFIQSDFSDNSSLLSQFKNLKRDLTNLAEIQLKEGSKQFEISKRAMDTVELFTQIEMYILIFLAIIIQIIVIYKPKNE